MILLYPHDGEAHMLLTVRRSDLPDHAGQVSLPGGALEPGETEREAALREAYEEVGADPARIRVLGELSKLHIPVSGFLLQPVVGVMDRPNGWEVCDHEVARLLPVAVADLLDPDNIAVENQRHSRVWYRVPYWELQGEKVWGATAMVLSEFCTLLDSSFRGGASSPGSP